MNSARLCHLFLFGLWLMLVSAQCQVEAKPQGGMSSLLSGQDKDLSPKSFEHHSHVKRIRSTEYTDEDKKRFKEIYEYCKAYLKAKGVDITKTKPH